MHEHALLKKVPFVIITQHFWHIKHFILRSVRAGRCFVPQEDKTPEAGPVARHFC